MTTEFDDLAQNGAQNEDELCRDIQMSSPDAFWALDYVERYKFGRFNKDFALAEDGRAYLFGVVEVPLLEEAGNFTWGVWGRSAARIPRRLRRALSERARRSMKAEGTLANEVPSYDDAFGARLEIVLHADRDPRSAFSKDRSRRRRPRG